MRSPVPGHTPTPPALQGGPSMALLVAELGVAALSTVGKDWFKGKGPKKIKIAEPLSNTDAVYRGGNRLRNVPTLNQL